MLKPSKKLVLAMEAVVDVAYHGGAEPVQSQDIARRLGLPRRYLEQVLQQLVRHGILRGVRGPRGGYRLARERRRITVGEVFRALRGDEPGEDDTPGSEGVIGLRVIGPFWDDVAQDVMLRLDGVSVDELCRLAEQRGIVSEGRGGVDFVI